MAFKSYHTADIDRFDSHHSHFVGDNSSSGKPGKCQFEIVTRLLGVHCVTV